MSESSRNEAQLIREQLEKACQAEVPNLAEVRKYREMFYEFLVDRTLEIMEADSIENDFPVRFNVELDVVTNDEPGLSVPRGPCSPVKSDEIRRFESRVKEVFGNNSEPCTTAWRI